jgi:hypothetical protein
VGTIVIAGLIAVLVLIVVGGGAADKLRTSQLESILTRLPAEEARAYYDVLRRHLRRVALLRAVSLVSLVCVFYALRQWLVAPP